MITTVFCIAAVLTAGPVAGPVELVADDLLFTEGPLWLPGEGLIFSDTRANVIYRTDKSPFLKPSGNSNGLALDANGTIVMCQAGERRIARIEKDGSITPLASEYDGKRLSTTNDLVIRSDGTIFFTDPRPLVGRARVPLQYDGVYALHTNGELKLLTNEINYANGIALSPDESTLYVAGMNEGRIQAFDLANDGAIRNGRTFCEVRGPDGMTVAQNGSLWVAGSEGVHVFDTKGALQTVIELPQMPTNCAFGGDDGKTLFITARKAVYKVRCTVEGIPRP